MKQFENARVQFTSIDPETEESHRVSLNDLVENVGAEDIKAISAALEEVVEGDMTQARLTETYEIV